MNPYQEAEGSWLNTSFSMVPSFIKMQLEMLELNCAETDPYTNLQTKSIISYSKIIEHSDAQPWASECPVVKNYKWRLNQVWHTMIYSCTHMTTVGVKGLKTTCCNLQPNNVDPVFGQ